MYRYLDILEVSQKQAYVYASNHLKDNVLNSATIAYITSPAFFEWLVKNKGAAYRKDRNLVYAGGGHTVLQFEGETEQEAADAARAFNSLVTEEVHRRYPEIQLFVKITPYREIAPGENLLELVKALESKKARRSAAFHQKDFGIEKVNANTLRPEDLISTKRKKTEEEQLSEEKDKLVLPEGYTGTYWFEDLGGSMDDSNFIAVVHIDGNGMGKRVSDFYKRNEGKEWEAFREDVRDFSSAIDKAFKDAFLKMNKVVAKNMEEGKLDALDLKPKAFPVRRLVTAGDDICFVSEGRIGVECAATFLQELAKIQKPKDGREYRACAGVAIVHRKFPFFRAYEMAESLCGNAKRYAAEINPEDNGARVSAIDWHIEFGELKDNLESVRAEYRTEDGKQLEMRPYIVSAPDEILKKDPNRIYEKFRQLMLTLSSTHDAYASGKVKQMRTVLKRGENAATHFIRFNKIESLALESYQGIYTDPELARIGSGKGQEKKLFLSTNDGKEHAILFDAVELLDTFLPLDNTVEGKGEDGK